MKFLIDNAPFPLSVNGLKKDGHEAVHVRNIGMHSASDHDIFNHAKEHDLTIGSADTDFGMLFAVWQ